MQVTELKPGKHGLYYVHLDGEYAFSAYPEILFEYDIHKDSALNGAALTALLDKQNTLYAKNRAMDILAAAACTEKTLFDKLCTRGIEPSHAAAAVAFCKQQGFVDDNAYIRQMIKYLYETKKHGIRRIKTTLTAKGFERELVDAALQEYEADNIGTLLGLLEKEPRENFSDRKQLSKLIQKLMRKGFLYSDIRTALTEYTDAYPEDLDA